MEEQNILNTETGTKESVSLTPKVVKIVKLEVRKVGEKGNQKLVCSVKHPDKEELIDISAVKYESKGKLVSTGLWINLDEDRKIRKGSALAEFMKHLNISKPSELEGKDINTAEDEKGYLCFKAY